MAHKWTHVSRSCVCDKPNIKLTSVRRTPAQKSDALATAGGQLLATVQTMRIAERSWRTIDRRGWCVLRLRIAVCVGRISAEYSTCDILRPGQALNWPSLATCIKAVCQRASWKPSSIGSGAFHNAIKN